MIFYGRYRFNAGAYRPSLTAYVLSTDGRWIKQSFLVDTGADITFLPQRSIAMLGIDTSGVTVKDDVGGVGGQGVPYIEYPTQVRLISPVGAQVLEGTLNVFLDPHASDVPLLGRDVLDTFTCIFDRTKEQVLLIEPPDRYELVRD
ncbi:MAG: aspartyl protease family protein [Deltaproteobacteria bacterium]|nr:aspartyl protease family protein [Deltaproteobacteria bacterium]